MNEIAKIIDKLDPEDAALQTAAGLRKLLPLLEEDARNRIIMNLLGEDGGDKITSMVHL